VLSDAGLAITPTHTLRSCPRNPDIVFVPGGTFGTVAAMQHRQLQEFLRDCSQDARFMTSVCTGALVLASAGLLDGRAATTHWAALSVLSKFGARPTRERVVRDGKYITGAGVSAGLDFGVQILEELRGRPYAQAVMLQAEYAPRPPIQGGTVSTTPAEIAGPIADLYLPFITAALAVTNAQSR
jgi:transcriptional regulator GlxA family with amidase domain